MFQDASDLFNCMLYAARIFILIKQCGPSCSSTSVFVNLKDRFVVLYFYAMSGALSLGVKRPGREAEHSPPSRTEVKNAWFYTSIPPIRLHGVVRS